MLSLLFIGIIILGNIYAQKIQTNCPASENIRPCTCKSAKDRLPIIHCDYVTNVDLPNVLKKGLQGYRLSEITFYQSNIGKLPSDAFRGIDVESITFLKSNVTALGDGINRPPFLGLEYSLKYLEMHDVFQNEEAPLKGLSLSHLKRLSLLIIDNNQVPVIGNDWFESGPYDLKELYFTNTSTRKLGSHVFASLTELKKISVTGGKFNNISRNMFPNPALHLESLDLSNNSLSTLPADMFSRMPSLEEVYLDNNAFLSISEVIWSSVWHQVLHVDLLGNPLNCDENMKWIYQYRLPVLIEGTCSQPLDKKGKALQKLTLADFQ